MRSGHARLLEGAAIARALEPRDYFEARELLEIATTAGVLARTVSAADLSKMVVPLAAKKPRRRSFILEVYFLVDEFAVA